MKWTELDDKWRTILWAKTAYDMALEQSDNEKVVPATYQQMKDRLDSQDMDYIVIQDGGKLRLAHDVRPGLNRLLATIKEMSENGGNGSQEEVCKYLLKLAEVEGLY